MARGCRPAVTLDISETIETFPHYRVALVVACGLSIEGRRTAALAPPATKLVARSAASVANPIARLMPVPPYSRSPPRAK